MRGRPVVPVIHVSPVEERPVELLKIDRRVRFPTRFVKVVVQDDDSTSRLRGLLHVDNRALRLADPLDCPGGGYDVEPIVEPVAERQNICAFKAQVSHSSILLNGTTRLASSRSIPNAIPSGPTAFAISAVIAPVPQPTSRISIPVRRTRAR